MAPLGYVEHVLTLISPARDVNHPMHHNAPYVRMALVASRPKRAVQRPVLNRLGNMFRFKLRNTLQVGNRAGDFQDAVMGAGAEPLLSHGAFEQALTIGGEFAELTNELRRHLGVAVKFFASGRKARQLDRSEEHTSELQ